MTTQPLHRPFLKWAGNKYRLVPRIRALLPPGARLVEPFVGSGALFVNTDYPAYLLADANPDLIHLYRTLQSEGQPFIDHCRACFTPANNTADAYYALRARFNAADDPREKSALFLYLNRHCYNGLCRYNSRGEFNVPFGRYKKPYFPAAEMQRFRARAKTATFRAADFLEVMEAAVPGDVLYCDPPYVPLSATAAFTSYSPHPFGEVEQLSLARTAEKLAARGIPVIISNHDTEFTRRAYANAGSLHAFPVQRYISCDGANRNSVVELLAVYSK